MTFPMHADFVISGAGIYGLSAAWSLAQRLKDTGKSVVGRIVILDKLGIACGVGGGTFKSRNISF